MGDQAQSERSYRLKASNVAIVVLGWDEQLEPQKGPVVGNELGRLQRDVDHYGAADSPTNSHRTARMAEHRPPSFCA